MQKVEIKYSLLLVDDDPRFHSNFREIVGKKDFSVKSAIDAVVMWECLEEKESRFDLIILDLKLDGRNAETGLKLIPDLTQKYPNIPIIVVTADNDTRTVVKAMKLKAKSFIYKDDDDYDYWKEQFINTIKEQGAQSKIALLEAKNKRNEQIIGDIEDERYRFVGNSPKVLEVKNMLKTVASSPQVTVLLTGGTGVGKEVAARYLHKMGPRADKPFVPVNLSAIPNGTFESALFGHKKGSFTGAIEDRTGYFQQADKGVLMLDEIGDIDSEIQIKLLRFLDNPIIRPVGAQKDIILDVQIITATHRNLVEEVAKGNFRMDLYQRLKTMVIEIPALRARKEDIPFILEHFLRAHVPNPKVSDLIIPEVIERLLTYHWPGNIRDLRNAVEYMMLRKRMFEKQQIDWDCVPPEILENVDINIESPIAKPIPAVMAIKSRKEEQAHADLVRIETALRDTQNDKTTAARFLGFKGTDHLRARIRTCYINFPHLFQNFPIIRENYASIMY